MSAKDALERLLYGEIPVVESPLVDSVTLITTSQYRSPEEQARMEEAAEELRRLAEAHPVTMEGLRGLRDRRIPLHNIPMPRTEEGDRLRALFRQVRKDRNQHAGEPVFGRFDYATLERRLIHQQERASWTLQDCHWRDGEE